MHRKINKMKKDGIIKKENINNEKEIKKENFDFIINILKINIGNIVDDFLTQHVNNKVTTFAADSFVRFIVDGMRKSKEGIIEEIKKLKL
jgi:hypothetical protein